jgi:hypothetical protein
MDKYIQIDSAAHSLRHRIQRVHRLRPNGLTKRTLLQDTHHCQTRQLTITVFAEKAHIWPYVFMYGAYSSNRGHFDALI